MEFLRRKRYSLSLDMAPLIDIVFLLLIFFMLSSSFLKPAIRLDLPKASMKNDLKREHVLVSMDTEQNIFINQSQTSLDHFEEDLGQVLAESEMRSVHLQSDKNVPYGFFVQVMDRAKLSGATQINLVHETES